MGKETQLWRVEVVSVVAEIAAATFNDFQKILSNDPSAAIGLDLLDRRHDDGAPKTKEKI